MNIIQPTSPEDMNAYFRLRWEILRAPWNQPIGSEQDEYESIAFHVMAKNDEGLVIGVGRLHSVDSCTAQIRYMAVNSQARNQGIGGMILNALEQQARRDNVSRVILSARDSALNFYIHHSYRSTGEGHTLYNQITHTTMQKDL